MDAMIAAAVVRVAAGEKINIAVLCQQRGISRKTFYKYVARYRAEGIAGFFPRSRAPGSSPSAIDSATEEAVVRARKELDDAGWDNGAISIRSWLLTQRVAVVPSRATIHRVLVRRGLVVPAPAKRPRRAWRRFERARANDLWQMDGFELLLAEGDQATVIQIIDDCTRLDLACHAATSENGAAAWTAFTTAAQAYGLPRQLLTDNSRAFSGHRLGWESGLAIAVRQLGVEPITSRPSHPQTCGKNERAHQTVRRWLARQPTPTTLDELQALLDAYRAGYNQRPHQALAGLTPHQRWTIAERSGPAGHPLPEPLDITRPVVTTNGTVGVADKIIGLGRAHIGQPTTIFRTGDQLSVFIGNQLLGTHTLNHTHRYQRLGT